MAARHDRYRRPANAPGPHAHGRCGTGPRSTPHSDCRSSSGRKVQPWAWRRLQNGPHIDSTICADIKARIDRVLAALRTCQRYPRNLTITCASEPHGMKTSLDQKSRAQLSGRRFRRCYRSRGSLSLAAAGGLLCARASCLPIASAIRRIRGSRGSPLCDPLSLAGQGPLRSSSFAMPTLPRQGPSDENSQESHDGSQKFKSSACGVEMLACGETLTALPARRALAGPAAAGQGRKPAEPGARTARALRGWRRSGPMATSR
jgi:hypothetical protein